MESDESYYYYSENGLGMRCDDEIRSLRILLQSLKVRLLNYSDKYN